MDPIDSLRPLPIGGREPLTRAQVGDAPAEQPDSREVARDFASLLMTQLVREMFDTVSQDGKSPFGNGPGSDIYRGMAERAFADAISDGGIEPLIDRIHEQIDPDGARPKDDTKDPS